MADKKYKDKETKKKETTKKETKKKETKKQPKQQASSSYLRNKKNTYRGLDQADPNYNSIDEQAARMEYEEENRKGWSDHLRSIFK